MTTKCSGSKLHSCMSQHLPFVSSWSARAGCNCSSLKLRQWVPPSQMTSTEQAWGYPVQAS